MAEGEDGGIGIRTSGLLSSPDRRSPAGELPKTPSTLYRARVAQSSYITPTRTIHKLASPVMSSMERPTNGLKDLLEAEADKGNKGEATHVSVDRSAERANKVLHQKIEQLAETVHRLTRRTSSLEKIVHALQAAQTRFNIKLAGIVALILLFLARR